ncbi:hypothetical protein NMS42_002466 [Vibrio cholerae]|nr:hypothetical protein [Vibrio cholerae]
MNWNDAITTILKSSNTSRFFVAGKPVSGEDERDLHALILYFTHSLSIMLSRQMMFNRLILKEESGWSYVGDGTVNQDVSLALLCLLEATEMVASLENNAHTLGQSVDVSDTLNEWRNIITNLPSGNILDCKEFTKHLMKELISNLQTKTLTFQPVNQI